MDHLQSKCIPVLLLGLVLAPPAAAELVVLNDGRFFRVSEYDLAGERAVLHLRVGGRLELPLERIDRVVDDEIAPQPEPVPETEAGAVALELAFAEDQPVPPTPWGEQIYLAARRHALNPALVAAVVRAESAYDAGAVSYKGARGLMQLMPATARRFGVEPHEIFEPARNLDAGTRYLAWLLERFDGDLTRALAAYNAGEGTVDRYGGVPPYRETRGYVRKIFRFLGLEGNT